LFKKQQSIHLVLVVHICVTIYRVPRHRYSGATHGSGHYSGTALETAIFTTTAAYCVPRYHYSGSTVLWRVTAI